MSKTLIVMASSSMIPTQIDDFGEEVERSRSGAIHFIPGLTAEITEDELEHIKNKHPDLALQLIVLNKVVRVSTGEPDDAKITKSPPIIPPPIPVESRIRTLIPDPPIPKTDDEKP